MSDTKQDDGGSAYPTPDLYSHHGMTLLDWFAGQALWRVEHSWSDSGRAAIAAECYSMAAAMIAEKRRREDAQR